LTRVDQARIRADDVSICSVDLWPVARDGTKIVGAQPLLRDRPQGVAVTDCVGATCATSGAAVRARRRRQRGAGGSCFPGWMPADGLRHRSTPVGIWRWRGGPGGMGSRGAVRAREIVMRLRGAREEGEEAAAGREGATVNRGMHERARTAHRAGGGVAAGIRRSIGSSPGPDERVRRMRGMTARPSPGRGGPGLGSHSGAGVLGASTRGDGREREAQEGEEARRSNEKGARNRGDETWARRAPRASPPHPHSHRTCEGAGAGKREHDEDS
jgi:hypothetical protein